MKKLITALIIIYLMPVAIAFFVSEEIFMDPPSVSIIMSQAVISGKKPGQTGEEKIVP
jgi:hypothetical protein